LSRLVVIVCLPLPSICAVLLMCRAIEPFAQDGAALIGFAAVFAYLFTFNPALYLCEPFAVIASIWLTRRWYDNYGAPFAPVAACWLAVLVHSAALAFFLRLGR
jgi:hypothetical protein